MLPTHKNTHMHTHIHPHTHTYIHLHRHSCIHTYNHSHWHARTHIHAHTQKLWRMLTPSVLFPSFFAARVLAFWNDHGAELKELFQPPQPLLLPNLKGAALINELQPVLSPVLNESISVMEAMFDGSLHIILTDWPALL